MLRATLSASPASAGLSFLAALVSFTYVTLSVERATEASVRSPAISGSQRRASTGTGMKSCPSRCHGSVLQPALRWELRVGRWGCTARGPARSDGWAAPGTRRSVSRASRALQRRNAPPAGLGRAVRAARMRGRAPRPLQPPPRVHPPRAPPQKVGLPNAGCCARPARTACRRR